MMQDNDRQAFPTLVEKFGHKLVSRTSAMGPCPICDKGHRTANSKLSISPTGRLLFICFACWAKLPELIEAGFLGRGETKIRFNPPTKAERELAEALAESHLQQGAERRRRLWDSAYAIPPDSPAWRYWAGRDIDPNLLIASGARTRLDVWHGESRQNLPATIFQVQGCERDLCQLHTIYHTIQGGRPEVTPRKRMSGPVKGGGSALVNTPDSDVLSVSEGVENGFSVRMMDPTVGKVIATLAAPNMASFKINFAAQIKTVRIYGDIGEAGERAATMLGQRCEDAGYSTKIFLPPKGVGDWNDMLLKGHG
ncbi:MAG: hypothetical protein GXP05_16400 [Alphaproteobacteria bacterium]|nr:hypothetical protein [Alphaproteobacteria bacterium]